ncbi:MAG: YegP family protein [Bacteroidota bacterium]
MPGIRQALIAFGSERGAIPGLKYAVKGLKRAMHFEIYRKKNDPHFYFRLCDEKGKVLLYSQPYKSKYGCKKGIASVRRNGGDISKYRKRVAEKKWIFIVCYLIAN